VAAAPVRSRARHSHVAERGMAALSLVTLALLAWAPTQLPATNQVPAQNDVMLPTTTESRSTETSHAWLAAQPIPGGYVEREFLMTGMAGIYTLSSPDQWTPQLSKTEPYTTRIVVRRPSDPAQFNGTVVIEWLNVTAGYDIDAEWAAAGSYFRRAGYAWVGVSAQAAGVNALAKWDPARYGSLKIVDDGQSYDIFSQAGTAVRQSSATVLGGLGVQRILGTGVSQSAGRLVTYLNAFHLPSKVYDGYLLHSRTRGSAPIQGTQGSADQPPAPLRTDLNVPALMLQTEGDLTALDYASARQPDTDFIRTWEVAGGPHVGRGSPYDATVEAGIMARDTGRASAAQNPTCMLNAFPIWPVDYAAWDHLNEWVAGGAPPPSETRLQLSGPINPAPIPPGPGNATIARDDMNNALGGIRTPALDAPTGSYSGSSTCASQLQGGALAGQFVPFDAETLGQLYPTHQDYVDKVTASAQAAVADGFMLPPDADTLVAEARASTIPSPTASAAPAATFQSPEDD
jgi:Alpha/beta hydrolase domain